jgi:peroxiredoxin
MTSCAGCAGARLGQRAGAALLAVAVLASLLSCQRSGRLVGRQAPEFSLVDLSGRTVRLTNLRGRVVFLNVWATWCEPCRAEMPAMDALYARLRGPDFELLAVSADQEGRAVVENFVRDLRLTFPVLLDPELQIADRYGVTGYPETFILDRNGIVLAHEIGPRAWDAPQSLAAFRRLLDKGEWTGF